jgi:hypothetical protein
VLIRHNDAPTKDEDKVIINMKEPVEFVSSLELLSKCTTATSLMSTVILSMTMKNYIAFEYRIEKIGTIKYYLTPKVDIDNEPAVSVAEDATHTIFTARSRAAAVSPTSVVDSPNKYQFEDLSKEFITIHVKTLKRGEFTIEVERSNTVDEVKTMIEEKEGIPYNRQHISFAGGKLTDPNNHF